MLRTLLGHTLRLLAVVLPLGLGACADTLSSSDVASSSELLKSYDKTLTKTEQQAVIDDLKGAKEKQEGESTSVTTAPTGTKQPQ
jgi:hypothetical protein